MRRLFYTLLGSALLMIPTMTMSQNGTRLIAFDAKTAGRGGTTLGTFDQTSLMMTNPAGISFLNGSQLDVNFSLMAPTLNFENEYNDLTEGNKQYFPLPSIGYVHNNQKKFSWGAGFFTQGGMGADFNLNHPLYTNEGKSVPQEYSSKFAVMQGGLSAAYKLTDKLSIGVSAHLVYSQMEFAMPFSMPPSMLQGVIDPSTGMTFGDLFSAPPTQGGLGYNELVAHAQMKDLTAFGFNGKIGLAYKPNEKFSLGINYSLPVSLTYDGGTAIMDMNAQMGDAFNRVVGGVMQQNPGMTQEQAMQAAMGMFSQMGIDMSKGAKDEYDLTNKMKLPQSFGAGIQFSPSQKLRLSLDAEWFDWENSFDYMELSMSGGSNPNINRMLGTEGTIDMQFPMEWKSSLVFRLGGEYDIAKAWTLRAGYAYGKNPVPAETLLPVFPAVVENHLTAGVSAKVSKQIALHFAYEAALHNDLNVSQSKIGSEYNNSTSGLKTSIFHLSMSWKLK